MPVSKPLHPRVASIRFEILLSSGGKKTAVFLRTDKVLDLLQDPGSLGDFLRGLANDGGD